MSSFLNIQIPWSNTCATLGWGQAPEVKRGDLTPVGVCAMKEKQNTATFSFISNNYVGHTFRNAGLVELICLTHDRSKLN